MPELERFEGLGPFPGVLLTIGLGVLIVWGLCWLFSCGYNPPVQSPLEILQQRFARGDISHAEYEQARRSLEES